MEYTRSQLSNAIKRMIKRKEKCLNKTCRTIWEFDNPKGIKYLFGSFCRNRKNTIVTLAYWVDGIGFIPA